MGNFLHRTTKQYFESVPPGELLEPITNYISMPDLSAVAGVSNKYWVITGDTVSEMSPAEKDTVDQANLESGRDSKIKEIDNLEGTIRQLAKMILGEINILRQQHGLTDRTIAQVRTQIREGYGS